MSSYLLLTKASTGPISQSVGQGSVLQSKVAEEESEYVLNNIRSEKQFSGQSISLQPLLLHFTHRGQHIWLRWNSDHNICLKTIQSLSTTLKTKISFLHYLQGHTSSDSWSSLSHDFISLSLFSLPLLYIHNGFLPFRTFNESIPVPSQGFSTAWISFILLPVMCCSWFIQLSMAGC